MLYLFLLGKQLHGVCLSFSGPMYFTKEKTHTCNPFIPILLTVDQTDDFPTALKLEVSVIQKKKKELLWHIK